VLEYHRAFVSWDLSIVVVRHNTVEFLAQGGFSGVCGIFAHNSHHDLHKQEKVLCSVILSNLIGVFAKRNIENPQDGVISAYGAFSMWINFVGISWR